jgi:exportin-2 (importin alpha re-exporter)
MDPNNDQSLETVRGCILSVMHPSDAHLRKQAEEFLAQFQGNLQFSVLLLNLINRLLANPEEKVVRQMAAVLLKNNIKSNWPAEGLDEEAFAATREHRDAVKTQIIEIICVCPPEVQKQLVEAISIIAEHDFPNEWSSLFPHLLSKMTNVAEISVSSGFLMTLNAVLKRFRYSLVNDDTMLELKFCLDQLQEPLLTLYQLNSQLIDSLEADGENLAKAVENQRLMTRIFFSLNVIDLPEYFEDHMEEWMTEFNKFLQYTNPLLVDEAETEIPGPLDNLKTAIIENLNLYAQKYEDEFKKYLNAFTSTIFQLLLSVGTEQKFDAVASKGILLLTSVCGKESNKDLFSRESLQSLVEQIVLNNMMLTQADIENFEDNPSDYIRKDHEGSDIFTRRRSATDLVRGLMKLYKSEVSEICLGYVNALFQQATTDWKYTDAAIHLVIAVSCMSTSATSGHLELNPFINIVEIIQSHILPELQDPDVDTNPFIKADALKMMCHFRSCFPADTMEPLLPLIVNYLTSKYPVVHTYAAICIDRMLAFTDADPSDPSGKTKIPRLDAPRLASVQQNLLTNLFKLLTADDGSYEIEDYHEYIMICIKQCLFTLDKAVLPITEGVFSSLMAILKCICEKEAQPIFNHNLFESIALLVRAACQLPDPALALENCNKFEAELYPSFQHILDNDIVEFVVYNYQIMAVLLSYRPSGSGLSDIFKHIFTIAVNPTTWETKTSASGSDLRISKGKGNIPALVDLLRAFLISGVTELASNDQITPIFGVFQQLLSVRSSEFQAFRLLSSLVSSLPSASFSSYMQQLLQLLLTRLQREKDYGNSKFSLSFLGAICHMAVTYDPLTVYGTLETITPNLVGMLATKVWPLTVGQVKGSSSDRESRLLLIGLSKLCLETPVVDSPDVFSAILKQCLAILAYMNGADFVGDLHQDVVISFEEEQDFESREFDSVYSKLKYAAVPEYPLHADCRAAPIYFARKLAELCATRPGYYSAIVTQCVGSEQSLVDVLMKVLGEAGYTSLD